MSYGRLLAESVDKRGGEKISGSARGLEWREFGHHFLREEIE
jgi:hypothetical protein